ncbi:NADP-dependent oxidoreductase [Stella sp.]|uniref:NADP-dependent oxidoreductase n=1 Tax=Stella sp. TaxID=2912054 RepID=UPI0035AED8DB
MPTHRRFVLAERPAMRAPRPTDFRLEEGPLPEPKAGEVLVRTVFLSLDPYMRGRISAVKSYARSVEPGETMVGEAVGEVILSRAEGFSPGDLVRGHLGWQTHGVLPAAQARRIVPAGFPLSYYLGVLGMPGRTAYFALLDIGQPKAGETVLVSAASGAVGQLVGQIARIKGARAVGIAGGPDKVAWCREIGFDAAFDYKGKDAEALVAAVAETCPDGVDVYFDNVGGVIHDAAMDNLNLRGRVIICGTISGYNRLEQPDTGRRHLRTLLVKRARMQGFLVGDYAAREAEFEADMPKWLREGRIRYREDVVEGFERMPEAFVGLLEGRNFGKLVVRAGPDPA